MALGLTDVSNKIQGVKRSLMGWRHQLGLNI